MKIICCYNLKGGVGKTTITNLLALDIAQTELQEQNTKILMIDADEQANLTRFFYNSQHQNKTIVDALINNLNAKEVIIKSPNMEYSNVDFIPSYLKMSIVAELISNKNSREKVALRWFMNNLETLKEYSHILIDLSPGTNIVNRNFLYIADTILGICEYGDIASLDGFNMFIERYKLDAQELELPKIADMGILMNKYTTRPSSSNDIFNGYLDNLTKIKELILDSKLHDSVAIKNAVLYTKSILDYTKEFGANKRSLEEMKSLTEELIKKEMI